MSTTTHIAENSYNRVASTIGIAILCLFLFFRPITVSFHHIGSISVLDIFGVASSYLLIMALLINLRNIRLPLIAYCMLLYVFYCLLSIAWGSEYRDIVRAIIPFLPFFLVVAAVREPSQVKLLLGALTLGYLLPIIGSTFLILIGKSDTMVTGSMLERQAGLSSGVHTTGHLMLFFSFLFALYQIVVKDKKLLHQVVMVVLLLGSLFCMYKTYTRTTMLGGLLFWSSYIWFVRRRWFLPFIALLLVVGLLKSGDVQSMVMQKGYHKQQVDLNSASSGREWLWKHNLKLFSELPFESQLLGVGLGKEAKPVPGRINMMWAGSHNDYLSLLVTVGVIGLSLYLLMYGVLILELLLSRWGHDLRFFMLSVIGSVLIMNLVSNSYIVRTQMAQLFWFLIGLLYVCREIDKRLRTAVAVVQRAS